MPRLDPFILGIAGRAGSGKDTAAEYLVDAYGYHRFAFADPLRDMIFTLLDQANTDHSWCTEPALKEKLIPGLNVSYRQLAQTLGTEWARKHFGEDFWLRTAELHLGLRAGAIGISAPLHERIVIPDVRFPNEAAWIRSLGGAVIHIERRGATPVRDHISEQHAFPVWTSLHNDGPVDQLHRQLDRIAELLNTPRIQKAALEPAEA